MVQPLPHGYKGMGKFGGFKVRGWIYFASGILPGDLPGGACFSGSKVVPLCVRYIELLDI